MTTNLRNFVIGFFIAVALTIGALSLANPRRQATTSADFPPANASEHWQYRAVKKLPMPVDEWVNGPRMRELGENGWELVAIQNYDANANWIFKKRL